MIEAGRWRLADGRVYTGNPLGVIKHLLALSFGFAGARDTLVPFAEWLTARLGCAKTWPPDAPDQDVADSLLGILEAHGHATRLTAEVVDIQGARARRRRPVHRAPPR